MLRYLDNSIKLQAQRKYSNGPHGHSHKTQMEIKEKTTRWGRRCRHNEQQCEHTDKWKSRRKPRDGEDDAGTDNGTNDEQKCEHTHRNVNTHKFTNGNQAENQEMGKTMQAQMMNSNVNTQSQDTNRNQGENHKMGKRN